MAPCALLVPIALLTRNFLLLPALALNVMMAVALWRGRRRVPDLLRALRSSLAWDETVLGDGLGVVPGTSGPGSLRVVVATDRRLLMAGSTAPLPVLALAYADVSRFGIEWTHRGRRQALVTRRGRDACGPLDGPGQPAVDRAGAASARSGHRRRPERGRARRAAPCATRSAASA
jgi:hypothetical protein